MLTAKFNINVSKCNHFTKIISKRYVLQYYIICNFINFRINRKINKMFKSYNVWERRPFEFPLNSPSHHEDAHVTGYFRSKITGIIQNPSQKPWWWEEIW